jgi:hypothetical protein
LKPPAQIVQVRLWINWLAWLNGLVVKSREAA